MIIPPKLTPREREILPMLALGETRSQIALRTNLSEETVKVHTKNIVDKFDATNVRDGIQSFWKYLETYTDKGYDYKFYLKRMETFLDIKGRGELANLTRRFHLVAVGDGLTELDDTFSADGGVGEFSIDGKVEEPYLVKMGKHFFRKVFDPSLIDGQEVIVNFEGTFIESYIENSEFMRVSVSYPTLEMMLSVSFDVNNFPKKIWAEKRMGLVTLTVPANYFSVQEGVATILVNAPEVHEDYFVRWIW